MAAVAYFIGAPTEQSCRQPSDFKFFQISRGIYGGL